jgi:membrane-anchored mycosin MYCP
VTTVIPGEKGGTGEAGQGSRSSGPSAGSTSAVVGTTRNEVEPPQRPIVNTAPRTTAIVFTILAGGAGVLLAFLAIVVPRGRRRGWRPGGASAPAANPQSTPDLHPADSSAQEAKS